MENMWRRTYRSRNHAEVVCWRTPLAGRFHAASWFLRDGKHICETPGDKRIQTPRRVSEQSVLRRPQQTLKPRGVTKFVIRPNKTCWNNSFSDCEQTLDDEARSVSACCFSRMTQYVARLSAPKHLSLESCWGPLGTGCPHGSCGSVGGAAAGGPGAGCDSGTRPSSAASVGPGDPSS